MSAADYAAMTTPALIERFVDTARRTGVGRGLFGLLDDVAAGAPPDQERSFRIAPEIVAELQALGAALRLREPSVAEIRHLFESPDRDVRASAAAQFDSIDPEWAEATWTGLFAGVSTRDVLSLRARVLRITPPRPTLKEMSDDALVARFEDAAMREYGSRFLGGPIDPQRTEAHNRITGEVWDTMLELKARDALDRLLPLFDNPNITVRREAATACLRVDEKKSIAMLEEVMAKSTFDDRVPAQNALEAWRKKGFAVYGV
jgi:HEAT repeat protein